MPAPIALFVYNRPDHTRQTVEALQKNILADQSLLYIFSDAPKTEVQSEKVNKVRDYVKTVKGFKDIHVLERTENSGLASSIISGVTELVQKYGKIIVLEDDLVTSPYFLKYMNNALEMYEQEESVISIHGYMYPVKEALPDTFFLKGADCWGWATWKRGWDHFEIDGKKLLNELKSRKLTSLFDFNDSYHYTKMLEDQISGKADSWAIRWYASAFLKEKFTLYPGKSLVKNIGFDGSGVHCEPDENYFTEISKERVHLEKTPVVADQKAFQAIEHFFRPPAQKKSLLKKLFNL